MEKKLSIIDNYECYRIAQVLKIVYLVFASYGVTLKYIITIISTPQFFL